MEIEVYSRIALWKWHRFLIDKCRRYERFSSSSKTKLLLVSETHTVARQQLFPFYYYRAEIEKKWDLEVREVPLKDFRENPGCFGNADIVCLQTWYDYSDEQMEALLDLIEHHLPQAKLCYFDWFAPTDLRYAKVLSERIVVYLKKHLLKDHSCYGKTTIGDTNLTDYYNRLYGIKEPSVTFEVPPQFLDKIVVGWNFAFRDYTLTAFKKKLVLENKRPIDLHCRINMKGTPWYVQMRQHAFENVENLKGLNVVGSAFYSPKVSEGFAPRRQYLKELHQSKLCFSPFGFGEVCWRDFEAIMAGALLVKQDMTPIETEPNIFLPFTTYAPVTWDFHDFDQVCEQYLSSETERRKVAAEAFKIVQDYIQTDQPLKIIDGILERCLIALQNAPSK